MVKDGLFYALGLGVVAAILGYLTGSITLVALPILLALFFLQFFRNPKRRIPTEPGLVVSPADGVVTVVEWVETKNGSRLRLSVFLSVFDVHVNRAPVSGTVAIDAGGYEVSFKLIAGLLARRIVCDLKVGDVLQRGQLIGMIKFGSRA